MALALAPLYNPRLHARRGTHGGKHSKKRKPRSHSPTPQFPPHLLAPYNPRLHAQRRTTGHGRTTGTRGNPEHKDGRTPPPDHELTEGRREHRGTDGEMGNPHSPTPHNFSQLPPHLPVHATTHGCTPDGKRTGHGRTTGTRTLPKKETSHTPRFPPARSHTCSLPHLLAPYNPRLHARRRTDMGRENGDTGEPGSQGRENTPTRP